MKKSAMLWLALFLYLMAFILLAASFLVYHLMGDDMLFYSMLVGTLGMSHFFGAVICGSEWINK